MTSFASEERAALCVLLDEVGPDAPTLCEGWSAYELAVHLAVRERRPYAAPGIAVPHLSRLTDKAMARYRASHSYAETVAALRKGQPAWTGGGVEQVEDAVNLVEFFVHHEDVRRAGPHPRTPRALAPELADALWRRLQGTRRVLFRRVDVPVVLRRSDTGACLGAVAGSDPVVVTGPVGELVLWSYGRGSAAQVTLEGPSERLAALRTGGLGV